MQLQLFSATAFTAIIVLVLTGCSNSDSRYSAVTGTITYNGEPVEGAAVNFQALAPDGESASGMTDLNGGFALTSIYAIDGGRGALPGEYRVIITKYERSTPDPDQEAYDWGEIDYSTLLSRRGSRSPASSSSGRQPKSLIPMKYTSPATSDLKATVVPGRNSPFVFDLVD